jgi:hypothetical protein
VSASADSAWVPPQPRRTAPVPAARSDTATALRLLDQSARAGRDNPDLSGDLTAQAVALIGSDAVLTIFGLQEAGELPRPGGPGWDHLLALADAGDVEIATVILIRDRGAVCDDRVAEQIRPPQLAEPAISLSDDLRQMGLLLARPGACGPRHGQPSRLGISLACTR